MGKTKKIMDRSSLLEEFNFENKLKDSLDALNAIALSGFEPTTRDVWGKDVRKVIKLDDNETEGSYRVESHELENWYISFKIDELPCDVFDANDLILKMAYTAQGYLLGKLGDRRKEDVTIHALVPHWSFLESPDGKIYKNNSVCLVMYAIILNNEAGEI